MEIRKQIRQIIRKQKQLIKQARNEEEIASLYGIWAGFLDGMYMTNALTKQDYDLMYRDIEDFRKETGAA